MKPSSTIQMRPTEVAKAKQVFGDSFPEDRENYFTSLKERVTEVISHRFSSR